MNLLDMVDLVNLVNLMDLVKLMNLEILVNLVNLVGLVDLIDLAYGAELKKLPEQQDLSRKNYPEKARKPQHFFEFTTNVPKIFGCQTFCEIETA